MQTLKNLKNEFDNELNLISDLEKLEKLRVKYLGKKSELTELMQTLKDMTNDQRKEFAKEANALKEHFSKNLQEYEKKIKDEFINKEIENSEVYDITLPNLVKLGSLHPITIVQKEVEDVFISMGFCVEDGNEIETEFNNFEAVNVPKDHPARDMQDTFWLTNGQVLKTHTSASQNRILRKYGSPCKVIFPGRCFRNESLDASHDDTFFQLEGMMVGKDITVANLIYFMKEMLSSIFKTDVEVRLRPGFFPFVEPGFELDIKCVFCGGKGCQTCKQGGWIELCPCGMIHPKVLELGGVDPKTNQGFAFGLGLTRLAMLKFNIKDIRQMNGNDIRFLKEIKTR